jgi:hypothetical protein
MRGGRKGGLPACEENGSPVNEAGSFAKVEGNTMIEDAPAKPKHFSAQVAMVPQSSMAFSQGLALCGQQSGMSPITDMVGSGDLALTPAPPIAGSMATDRATRSAKSVRPMLMISLGENSRPLGVMVK